jgi:hypothetical protein
MRKTLLLVFLLFLSAAKAQTIQSLTVVPANPTTADNIYILAVCSFTSGPCDAWTQNFNINGSLISASAMHCLGMLTVICTDTDSFAIGMLPAGTYNVTYQVDEGHGGPPCTPGIVPGPTSNTTFIVSTTTDIPENSTTNNVMLIYPNPVMDELSIALPSSSVISVLDITGRNLLHFDYKIGIGKPFTIDVSSLKPGIYFIRARSALSEFSARFVKE